MKTCSKLVLEEKLSVSKVTNWHCVHVIQNKVKMCDILLECSRTLSKEQWNSSRNNKTVFVVFQRTKTSSITIKDNLYT